MDKRIARQYGYTVVLMGCERLYRVSQKCPLEITLLLLNVCYYASGNLNELST